MKTRHRFVPSGRHRIIGPCKAFWAGLLLLTAGTAVAADPQPGDILLGMSTALSGPTAELGREMQRGVLAGLERANRRGGIKGRRLRLVTFDDGYEPARTAPNMRRLIEEERVLAVVGNVGTPTAIASLPIANDHRTLFFAPFSGAGVLRRQPPDRYVINYRASYAEEIGAMVDALIDIGKVKPEEIAFFTQRDGYGDAGYVGGFAALKKHGLKNERSVLHVRYQRNTLAVENALADLLYAEQLPRAVIMVGAYAPCAKFIRLARDSGVEALFLCVSFIGSSALAHELEPETGRVIVTQVVPPLADMPLPIIRDYRSDLRLLDPTAEPTFVSLEGYIAARIFLTALERIKAPPDRSNIIDALEGLGSFDLGLGRPLLLGPKEHQASHAVWPTRLVGGRFLPFDWADIGTLLPKRTVP